MSTITKLRSLGLNISEEQYQKVLKESLSDDEVRSA